MAPRRIPSGRPIPRVKPGSPDWLQLMTGSKIAAVLGLSPFESRFSLWHRMAGALGPDAETDEQSRGHYLEPVVCQWWADQHPEYRIRKAPTYVHRHRPWQAASPDRIAVPRDLRAELLRILTIEAKSDAGGNDDNWGDEGTDQIPVYYQCQVQWTMDVLGLEECRLPVILPRLEFREYVIMRKPDEAEYMRAEAIKFLASIRKGERPSIDEHNATYRAVQKMHPGVEDDEIELPADLDARYRGAYADLQTAKADEQRARSEVADYMGNARRAIGPDEKSTAIRAPGRGDKPPYVKYAGPKVAKPKAITSKAA